MSRISNFVFDFQGLEKEYIYYIINIYIYIYIIYIYICIYIYMVYFSHNILVCVIYSSRKNEYLLTHQN